MTRVRCSDLHTNKCEKEEHADCPCVDFDINSDIVDGEGGSESGVGGVATTYTSADWDELTTQQG